MDVEGWYSLVLEYETTAHKYSREIATQEQVDQYYQLIDMAIKILISLKENNTSGAGHKNLVLSVKQDIVVTLRLVRLLVEETWNLDLAENYLSSLLERLQNQQLDLSIWNHRLTVQYWLIGEIPFRRDNTVKFHLRVALRNYQDVMSTLNGSDMDPYYRQFWKVLFEFVSCQLYIRLQKVKLAHVKFEELIRWSTKDDDNNELTRVYTKHPQWYGFIFINYLNVLLDQRLQIPENIYDKLVNDPVLNDVNIMGPHLYVWKLLLQLIIMINKDLNITLMLNEFKLIFDKYKQELSWTSSNDDKPKSIFTVNLDDDISIDLKMNSFLQYRDIKLILLLLQSVSYLLNCYDKNAQFSVKFLPKVESTLRDVLQNNNDGNNGVESLSIKDNNLEWYNNVLTYVKFYQIWEGLLLNRKVHNSSVDTLSLQPFYLDLIKSIEGQEDIPFIHQKYKNGDSEIDPMEISIINYQNVIENRTSSREVKLMSLLNSYILILSQIETLDTDSVSDRQSHMIRANETWKQIELMYTVNKDKLPDTSQQERIIVSDLYDNPIWRCTIIIVWIISHFEPFTWTPLPSNDNERNYYLEELKKYYQHNKILGNSDGGNNDDIDDKFILKKSLLLRLLINYLGAKLFETNLDTLCQISLKCFKFAKQDKHLINIRYIIGLWHLMNCTVAMKPKEVAYTTAKLEQLVNQMEIPPK